MSTLLFGLLLSCVSDAEVTVPQLQDFEYSNDMAVEASYGAAQDEGERFEEPEEGFESASEDVLDVRHAEGAHIAVLLFQGWRL